MNAPMTVIHHHTVSDIERMARAFAVANLFGVTSPDQALALCLIAQAEGRHPASAAQDYHIIKGKPSKKADAMLRDFLAGGGKVEWHHLDDAVGDATFSHPAGGSARIKWDMDRAFKAELFFINNGKRMKSGRNGPEICMWERYPRQMLRARVVSEGVRTVFPMATSGMYVPEEVQEFATEAPRDVTPPALQIEHVEPPPITTETINRETGEITTHSKTADTRQIDGEMRAEIDACLDATQLRRLWRSKAFKAEMDKHPPDWKDAVTDYANERFAEMEAEVRKLHPVKGYQEPDFSHLETTAEDSLPKAQFKASLLMETAAAALADTPSPEALKERWDVAVEGVFEGEAYNRLLAIYEAKLKTFGVGAVA